MTPSSGPFKVAIVGAGNMAPEHAKAFAAVPGVTVAGIHSRTRSRAEDLAAKHAIGGVYDSIAELHERTRADLVVVTVFETAMKTVATSCFEFPWAVMLEKPPGMHAAEAREIEAAARARGRKVYVGLNRRFLSSTRAVKSDLDTRGGPRYIRVQDQQSLETAAAIGHPPVVVENWMYANSIHLVDYLRLLGRGAVTRVVPVMPWRGRDTQVMLAQVEFASGDTGLYEGIWNGPGPWAVAVSTPERRWEIRPLEQAVYQTRTERTLHPVEVHSYDRDFKPGFRLQAEQVVAAVRGEPSDAPTLAEGVATMDLIERIFARA